MYRKILVANRGEVAIRVIRSARELGIKTVTVYSEGDKESMHVLLSDETVCIGPAVPSKSYLNPVALISAATLMNCDAIHPGYGFLSENAQFAEYVKQCGLGFIGPEPKHIKLMGDKVEARKLAKKLNIPIIPGSEGRVASLKAALKVGNIIGYPILLKASGGGGGRGMKIVRSAKELEIAFYQTQKEVTSAFGNSDIYIEKYLLSPRHIEVQILGDGKGEIVSYGLRDCSIQRRHQKVVEEAEPCHLSPEVKEKLESNAINLGQHLRYLGAGTIEYLLDGANFYFIEMNTRIQVEHPITEMITRSDLIKEQILISAKRRLSLTQSPTFYGHAIECRINAEHPETLLPSVGTINGLHLPGGPGVRVDTFIYDQYSIPPHYDSLLAKIICWDHCRVSCISKMRRALKETIIRGIHTNVPLHLKILDRPDFIQGQYDINFLSKCLDQVVK